MEQLKKVDLFYLRSAVCGTYVTRHLTDDSVKGIVEEGEKMKEEMREYFEDLKDEEMEYKLIPVPSQFAKNHANKQGEVRIPHAERWMMKLTVNRPGKSVITRYLPTEYNDAIAALKIATGEFSPLIVEGEEA